MEGGRGAKVSASISFRLKLDSVSGSEFEESEDQ